MSFALRAVGVAAALGLLVVTGCTSSKLSLSADLRTDWVSGEELVGVRMELYREAPGTGAPALDTQESLAVRGTSFVRGRRVAEWTGLDPGEYWVRATLLERSGETRARRITQVTVRTDQAIIVVVTRGCAGVVCPGPSDDPSHTECFGARCVDPSCTPMTPEACGTPSCAGDADCTTTTACAAATCFAGACLLEAHDERCAPDEWCSPADGCHPLSDRADAGARDAGSADAGCPSLPDLSAPGPVRISSGVLCPVSGSVSATYVCEEGTGRIELAGGSDVMLELYGPGDTVLGGAGIVPTGPGAVLHLSSAATASLYVLLDLHAFPLTLQVLAPASAVTIVAQGANTLTTRDTQAQTLTIRTEGPHVQDGYLGGGDLTIDVGYVPPPACAP